MSTVVVSIDDLYEQFKARLALENRVRELESLLEKKTTTTKKPRAPKEPNEPKSDSSGSETSKKKGTSTKKPSLSPEELKEVRRQNGLKLAEYNRARKAAAAAATDIPTESDSDADQDSGRD